MTDKNKFDNVIPLIREKNTRDIIRDQFNRPPSERVKSSLDSINQKMTDLKEMIRKQNEYLNETGSNLVNRYAAEGMKETLYQDKTETNTLDTTALEAEYRRKQDEMRKKRKDHNRDVTRSYKLNKKPDRDRD